MRRSIKVAVLVGVVASLGAAGSMIAYADSWTVTESRLTLTAKAAKMPVGVKPSVAKQSKAAIVSWSSQEVAAGVLMDHYVVTAHSENTPPLPDVTHTVTAGGNATESVTFAPDEVAGGTWRWTVIPKFRLWVGAASGKSQRLTFPGTPVARPAGDAVTSPADPAADAHAPAPAAVAPTSPDSPVVRTPDDPSPVDGTTTPPATRTNPATTDPAVGDPDLPESTPSTVTPSASGSPPTDDTEQVG